MYLVYKRQCLPIVTRLYPVENEALLDTCQEFGGVRVHNEVFG